MKIKTLRFKKNIEYWISGKHPQPDWSRTHFHPENGICEARNTEGCQIYFPLKHADFFEEVEIESKNTDEKLREQVISDAIKIDVLEKENEGLVIAVEHINKKYNSLNKENEILKEKYDALLKDRNDIAIMGNASIESIEMCSSQIKKLEEIADKNYSLCESKQKIIDYLEDRIEKLIKKDIK